MEITERIWTALSTVAAVASAAAAAGLVFVAGTTDPAAVAMTLLGAAFFGLSAFPAVRADPAYDVLSTGYPAALFALWYLVVRGGPGPSDAAVTVVGAAAVLAAGGLLVELYGYRRAIGSRPN